MDAAQIASVRDDLDDLLGQFDDCFYRKEVRSWLGGYVRGQLSDLEAKSCEPIALAAGKGSSRNIVAGLLPHRRPHVELATEEENPGSIVGKLAKSSCSCLYGLNATIKSFGRSVADRVLEPRHDAVQIPFDHLGHFHNRLQATANGPRVPVLEKLTAARLARLVIELLKQFANGPRPCGLQLRSL